MNILVTGGSGFIGTHLVDELRKQKHKVTTLSNDKSHKKDPDNIYADITDRKTILKLIPQFDAVYHFAGLLGTSELITESYEASEVNILGTVNILDGALKNKTKVVYVAKPNVWLNTYSITKYAGESFTKMYSKEMGLPAVSVKLFNAYGPHQTFHCQKVGPFFIRWALKNEDIEIWGDGEQTMDVIHARDAVRAVILIANKKNLEGQTIDVGSGEEITVNEFAQLVIKLTGSKSKIKHLPMRPGETDHTRLKADAAVLKKLGFKYKYTLIEGLKETIEWYKKYLHLPTSR